MNLTAPSCWLAGLFTVVFICLLGQTVASAQTSAATQVPQVANPAMPTEQSSSIPAVVVAYRQTAESLLNQQQALESSGATATQLNAWKAQNAALFSAQQQRTQAMVSMATNSANDSPPIVELPSDVSNDLADFMNSQVDLSNRAAQFATQMSPAGKQVTVGAQSAIGSQAGLSPAATFQQQNATEIQAQTQRMERIIAQAGGTAVTIPPPLVLRSTLPANLQAFLTLQDQLFRSKLIIYNQYVSADAPTRQAAEENWETQNASLLKQEQDLAAQLVPTQ